MLFVSEHRLIKRIRPSTLTALASVASLVAICGIAWMLVPLRQFAPVAPEQSTLPTSPTLQPRPPELIENSVKVGKFDVPAFEWSYSVDDVAITDDVLLSVEVSKSAFSNGQSDGISCSLSLQTQQGGREPVSLTLLIHHKGEVGRQVLLMESNGHFLSSTQIGDPRSAYALLTGDRVEFRVEQAPDFAAEGELTAEHLASLRALAEKFPETIRAGW